MMEKMHAEPGLPNFSSRFIYLDEDLQDQLRLREEEDDDEEDDSDDEEDDEGDEDSGYSE
jgi:hypothetical protein